MAERNNERLYSRIRRILNDEMDSTMFNEFKNFARPKLARAKVNAAKNASEVFDLLVEAGHIKGRDFGVLITMLKDANLIQIMDIVSNEVGETSHLGDQGDGVRNAPSVVSSLPSSRVSNNSPEQRLVFKTIQTSSACKDWRMLGRELCVKEADLEAIASDCKDDLKEKCYQMLVTWLRAQPLGVASPSILINALKSIEHTNVADDIVECLVQKPFN